MFTPLDFTSISRPEISESLVGMFKGTVQRFSDRIAIEDWSGTPPTKQQYSYAELDNASDHLAKTLQANGIHRGCLVPILTTRSMPMVIAVLGVLKAGACYVPIDLSAWGADRIEVTLKTVGAAKVLCTEASSAIPPEYEVIQFLATDAVWTPAHDPSSLDSPTPDDLAYIIFTSGSTGRPKGVKVAHRSMVAYAYENGAGSPLKFVVTAESRMLVMFSIAFDGCAGVFFSCLGNGSCLVLANPDTFPDAAKECTDLPLTPSILSSLDPSDNYGRVERIILGGEKAPDTLIEAWSAPGRKIFNAYGPTEATCVTLMAELVVGQPQTLGFALRGAFVILRDENGDEADAGEICIGGTGVALGYFQDEARTEQSFITYRGERLYCTGDYGRMSFAGVVFAGRKDSLVKNRGFLINLETEVEPLLLDIPAVEIGIAVSVETRLYAFVCPASTAIGLRDDLLKAGKSPFLVPDRIVGMDNLPLTSNGKIDRKELIALLDTSNSPTVKPDPHEELGPEEAVSKAFSVALKLPESQITPVSSFRQLGGSSLAAVSVVTTIKRYSFATSLSQIFQMDTVAAISQSLTRIGQGQPQPKLDIARQELWKSVNDTLQTETDGIVDVAPMTDLQMRMIHGTLQDRSANYLRLGISFAHGSLSKLKRSWLCALAAHSSLRTTFLLLGERGAQLIHQQVDPSWEELPVQELPTEEEWRNLQYLSTEETLSTPSYPHIKPFIGFRVYSAPHGATLVTLTIHHSLIDGWSAVNLIESFSQAADGCLPSLPRPEFHQFIKTIDQSHFLVKEKAQAFWKENLGNLDPIPRLTLPVPSTPNSPAKRKEVCVSLGTTSAKLESQSLRARVTPAVFLYAAWSIVLSTYSASDEVVVGATLAGRSWPISEIESAVGPFVNTLPLRVQIDERESSERFLQTVFTTLCQISDYQGSTNSLIQTATGEKATEFYETIFALQYDFPPLSSWKSDTIAKPSSFWTTDSSGAKLNVLVEDSAEGLVARLVYHTDSFTTSAVEGMGRHLQNVLEAFITQDLSEPVSRIRDQLLKPTEIDALVRSFPRFNDQYVGAVNLKEAFESMVDRVPDFPALESPNGEVLTYRELDRRSNAVALEIMRLDSKSPFVAVQADGSVEWIVAIFATIKTGYAYCPIDVKYGRDRQKVMLDLAESDIIIYSTADSIPSDSLHPGLRFLTVDTIVGSIDEIKPVRFQTTISGESIAALIFTSGSTGVPKGVQIPHVNLLSSLGHEAGRNHSHPGQRNAQLLSYGFDGCLHEILAALLYGATLVLKDENSPMSHLRHVDAADITPSMLATLDPKLHPKLKILSVVGEVFPQDLVDQWGIDDRILLNVYGPVETTIAVTWGYQKSGQPVTNGPPAPRTAIYIVDKASRPVPVGCTGEIFISGIQVTPGYHKLPDRTRQSFVPDPFLPGQTVYRTGDIGRWTPDMSLQVIGRMDYQVKVRGLRVDLQEVEHMITKAFNGIQSIAVVFSRELAMMTAFVTPGDIDVQKLQHKIRSSLPYHCQPTRVVALENFPLNVNGKIDRLALLAIPIESTAVTVLPETEMECLVARIWEEKLPQHQVGALDNFFDLGGHSLLQIGVAQRLTEELAHRVPLRMVIENIVLRDLAAALETKVSQAISDEFSPFCQTREAPLFITSGLEEEVYNAWEQNKRSTAWNVALAMRFTGPLDRDHLWDSFSQVINYYPVLLSEFAPVDGILRRSIRADFGGPLQLPAKVSIDKTISDEINLGFDLNNGQPIRVRWIEESPVSIVVVITMSHAVSDGTTRSLLLDAISAAYNGTEEYRGLPVDQGYMDWASWSSQQKPDLEAVHFWQKTLAGYTQSRLAPFINKPQTYDGHCRMLTIPQEGRQAVTRLEAEAAATKHHVVLAIVSLLLQSWGESDSFVIGAPYANRDMAGTDKVIGMMVDRIPIRVELLKDDTQTLRSLVSQMKGASQQSIAHWIPFTQIMKAVVGKASIAHENSHLFDVMVTFHTAFETTQRMQKFGNAEMTLLRTHPDGAKYPLLFEFTEWEDRLELDLEYDTGVLSEQQVDRIQSLLMYILSTLATQPDTSVGQISEGLKTVGM